MIQKIIKSGNSLAVTIPVNFAEKMGIKKGDKVKVERRSNKAQLILHFEGVKQMALGEINNSSSL